LPVGQGDKTKVGYLYREDHITVKAVDAAGNRSAPSTGPSTTNVVTGYPC
jgi:hypothetical protein